MSNKTHFGFKEVDEEDKQKHVRGVFSSVAESYDVMNDAMSMGMHRLWKKIMVELAEITENSKVLDIASGTGDIAKLISQDHPACEVFMTDINMEMLSEGRDRSINESFAKNTHFCQLNGEALPFEDNTFDIITIGFGLRNFTNKSNGLKKCKGVSKMMASYWCLSFQNQEMKLFQKFMIGTLLIYCLN